MNSLFVFSVAGQGVQLGGVQVRFEEVNGINIYIKNAIIR